MEVNSTNHPAMGINESGVALLEEVGINTTTLMLPSQYYGARGKNADFDGERRLLLAVLVDAIHCWNDGACGTKSGREGRRAEAREWVDGHNSEDLFAFEGLCSNLDINPDYLRQGMLAWEARGGKLAFHKRGMPGAQNVVRASRYAEDRRRRSKASRREASMKTALEPKNPAAPPIGPLNNAPERDWEQDPDPRDLPGPEVNTDGWGD